MTEQQHPITPPPELVQQWRNAAPPLGLNREKWIATQAARWGADQELEACIEWLWKHQYDIASVCIRDARRPKPPSLAVRALIEFESHQCAMETNGCDTDLLRAALERLQELEKGNE